MNRTLTMELMRLLHGELPEESARELRERMGREPALAAAYRRLEAAWSGLDLPPAAPPPPGFAGRVMARARESAREPLTWGRAPVWVRATAAAALAAGLAAGVGLGGAWQTPVGTVAAITAGDDLAAEVATLEDEGSLAESYWAVLEESEAAGAADATGSEALP